jgi:hypothetical protein
MGRRKILLLVFLLGLPITRPSLAAPISDTQAQQLIPAIAKVMLQRTTTTALLHYCGQHYPLVRTPAAQAATAWLHSNHHILAKADSLRKQLLQMIQQQQSRFRAEMLGLDIDKAVHQSVQHFEHLLASYTTQQQVNVCHHLIHAVRAGEWDVQRKQAKAFAILENFH